MSEFRVTQSDNASTISTVIGDILGIELAASPTTGFRWVNAPYDANVLELLSDSFVPEITMGGGGTQVYKYVSKGRGNVELRFSFKREREILETFFILVTVT